MKAAADPVEETDAVLTAKLCGSITTLSLATSYLASGSFILFLRFFTCTQTQTTTTISTIMMTAPVTNMPISNNVNTGGSDGAFLGAGVRVSATVVVTGAPEKKYQNSFVK